MSREARPALFLVLAVLAACSQASSAPSTSFSASEPGASQGQGSGNLPPGCETIDLRAPDGSTLDLDGGWVDESRDDAGQMEWEVRTLGNCFYGVGTPFEPTEYSDSFTVQVFTGTIQDNFTIDGAFLHMGGHNDADTTRVYVPAVLLIEFTEDGGVVIREDREPNVIGPRCPRPEYCAQPLELH